MVITSRESLKEFALRKNGSPIVEVNVTDDQLEDAVDLAIQHISCESVNWDNYDLKLATAAFVRQQWGLNLMTYDDVQLIGGVKLNGSRLYESATAELERLKKR